MPKITNRKFARKKAKTKNQPDRTQKTANVVHTLSSQNCTVIENLNSESYCWCILKWRERMKRETNAHAADNSNLCIAKWFLWMRARWSSIYHFGSVNCINIQSTIIRPVRWKTKQHIFFGVTPYSYKRKRSLRKAFGFYSTLLFFGNVNKSENNSGNSGCAKAIQEWFLWLWII